MFNLQFSINDRLYLRDPQQTKLGRNIIQSSIFLIDELGFEAFTFKKLADHIQSTEASVYRYFVNKHLLLLYLLNWYWEWMDYQIDFRTHNVTDPSERLQIALHAVVATAVRNSDVDFVDEDTLHRIVVAEATKAYHTKSVDEENRQDFFIPYKALTQKISAMVSLVNPSFVYPVALASTLLEMANDQTYFALHLPALTDVRIVDGDRSQVGRLLCDFAFGLLGH